MNWTVIGVVGQWVASVAVVVSVVYLAVQVRKQTEESRLSATRDICTLYHGTIADLQRDKEFSGIYLRGVRDYESVGNHDRIRLALFFQNVFRVMEIQYLHTLRRTLDPVFFESVNLSFKEFLTLPGVQRWWRLSERMFEEGFRRYVDSLIVEARQKGYDSSFKREHEKRNGGSDRENQEESNHGSA
jgi:hypothetical protein